jgi:hypothetical protein
MGDAAPGPWWKRLAWFVGLWAGGVAAVAAVAFLLRLWIARA